MDSNDESSDEYDYYSDEDHYDMESSSKTANEVINNQSNQQARPRALNFLPLESLMSKRNHTSKMQYNILVKIPERYKDYSLTQSITFILIVLA